jgi:hypothetical protein
VTTSLANFIACGCVEQMSPNRKRTINSFEAQFAKDRFIKCGRGGSNIAFCKARIAAEASDALFDERFCFIVRSCALMPWWRNK